MRKPDSSLKSDKRRTHMERRAFLKTATASLGENPEVLTTALANAHKFVPDRVFTLGGDSGANSLAGAFGILGDFLGGQKETKSAPAPAKK